jgi:hypothetical protein
VALPHEKPPAFSRDLAFHLDEVGFSHTQAQDVCELQILKPVRQQIA